MLTLYMRSRMPCWRFLNFRIFFPHIVGSMKRYFFVLGLFAVVFIICCLDNVDSTNYLSPTVLATHPSGDNYVGSETCRECHADVYAKHMESAHFQTSSLATSKAIHGSFAKKDKQVQVGDYVYNLLRRNGESYEQGHNPSTGAVLEPNKMDIVIGSGLKGQSYLTWKDDALYQCQISYYPPADSWINSPGYPVEPLLRPVRDGCLKCHLTHATNKDFSGQGNRYEVDKMIYGIGCERCHRPGEKHVVFHRQNPDAKESRFMLELDTLDRDRRLDLCAQCHSGPRDNIIKGNSFSFLSGERLEDYSRNFHLPENIPLDVHGNQVGLLQQSKCFQESIDLDCGTCHDPHEKQRGMADHFNSTCNKCHDDGTHCSVSDEQLRAGNHNCISCHMPNTPSQIMTMQLHRGDEETPVLVRSHLVGIYPRSDSTLLPAQRE